MPASVPGAAEFAYPIAELEQAQRLRGAIDDLHPDAPVTVVGAGLTGIEAATELAEQGRKVTLVCGGQLGPSLSEPGRRSVAKVMAKLGIAVLETDVVTEVRADAVVFADGAVRPSAVTIWTAGFGVPDLAVASGLQHRRAGPAAHRRDADQRRRSAHRRRRATAPPRPDSRCGCAAHPPRSSAPQAANTVLSRIAGTEPARFEYGIPAQCISLGRNSGILQFARKDDTAVNYYFSGRLTARVKEAICKGTLWGMRREARKPGSTFWFKGGPRPEQPAFAPKVATET